MDDVGTQECGLFCAVPGPLQAAQRAEIWGGILALQARTSVHTGGDKLYAVSTLMVRSWMALTNTTQGHSIKDGDLLLPLKDLLAERGWLSTRITEVTGHAEDELVRIGAVEQVVEYGNDQADSAAHLGCRRVDDCVIDRRGDLSQACHIWYPVVKNLHRYFGRSCCR